MTADYVRAVIAEVIAEMGGATKKEMGKVMQAVMQRARGRFPGGEVKPLVEAALS